ncbi:MAG: dehydrogenase, partial [Planctomycetes bacterium]|nr:dehydrogenase [Planctomycetota bacterium]
MLSVVFAFLQAALPEPLAPDQTVSELKVPEGFSVKLFAGEPDVKQPISFCIDDRGRLWVAENYSYPKWTPEGKDRILIFEDTDGDGKFDRRTVFCEGLTMITGLEVGFGGAWVVAPPRLLFIPDKDGDDKPDGPPVTLLDGFGNQGGHNIVNGFTWGPDGWLYAGHGRTSISDLGPPGTPPEKRIHFDGGVWRYHPTRHVFEAWCDGTTNPWGVAFNDYGQAIITTCVDVHLYHAIQGAHFEPWRGRANSLYAYGRIASIADHKHWVGSSFADARSARPEQLALGGGHAHCGAMVYLGDSFPDSYRGSVFMSNLHGHRLNNDLLERSGSGFIGRHGPDFLTSNDRMVMALLLQYGPDGSVFVSDWYDRGECHTRNPNDKTGRIYKVVYKDAPVVKPDLARLADAELVRLQLHKNDWFVTHARRILQERAALRPDPAVQEALKALLKEAPETPRKLRALWALHATGGATEELLLKQLESPEEYLRAWAVQLAAEPRPAAAAARAKFAQMASTDPSPLVRLYLAAACQRLAPEDRWTVAERLASHAEDAADPNLPLMIWYAAEPMAAADLRRA